MRRTDPRKVIWAGPHWGYQINRNAHLIQKLGHFRHIIAVPKPKTCWPNNVAA